MVRSFTLSFALVAIVALPLPVAGQTSPDTAAEAAQLVAARADSAFERIDPDLDTPPVIEVPASDEAVMAFAGLPPLPQADEATIAAQEAGPEDFAELPRDPAVRMIASEVVQPLPVAAPAPARAARASNAPFVIKSILPIEGSIRYGDWFWDESAAPQAGKLVVTVDLEARVISAFRDGHEIGTAVALLGTQSHPTPVGAFPVLWKSREHFSRKYNNAPMPWSLWLTNTGIAIHGSPVVNGYASHGCIGVPDDFAAKLFAAMKKGDKVIITRGKMVGIGDKVL
jgi:hypothetical protein